MCGLRLKKVHRSAYKKTDSHVICDSDVLFGAESKNENYCFPSHEDFSENRDFPPNNGKLVHNGGKPRSYWVNSLYAVSASGNNFMKIRMCLTGYNFLLHNWGGRCKNGRSSKIAFWENDCQSFHCCDILLWIVIQFWIGTHCTVYILKFQWVQLKHVQIIIRTQKIKNWKGLLGPFLHRSTSWRCKTDC